MEDDDRSIADLIPDQSEDGQQATVERDQAAGRVRAAVQQAKSELKDPRLDVIIQQRVLNEEPKTLAELGKMVNLSREGVRLIENRLLDRVKQILQEEGNPDA